MFFPEVLNDNEVKFTYGFLSSEVNEIEIVKVDSLYNEQASYKLSFNEATSIWQSVLPFKAGELYRLRIKYKNGSSVEIIDPAAPFLPNGVLGFGDKRGVGQIWDHKKFQFQYSRPKYQKDCHRLIEEIHIGTFTQEGTFRSACERLPFLAQLGVTDLQVMPLNATPGDFNWGYDGSNWYAVNHHYGTPDDFKIFIDIAHKYGMRVILDVVYNHTGSEASYQESLFGSIRSEISGSPWGAYLDFTNRGFREFTLCNAEYWLSNFNLDGLRIDAMWAIKDDSSPKHVITELVERCRAIYDDAIIVFETNDDLDVEPRLWKSLSSGGFGDSDKDRIYRNNDWFIDVVLRFFPKELLFDWMKQVLDRSLEESATRLNNLRTGSQKSIFDHDHIGNIFPFKRLRDILISAYGDELGQSALRTIFALNLITKGDTFVFQGDIEGLLTKPFPYFRQCLSSDLQRGIRKGRLKELGTLLVNSEDDLKKLLQEGFGAWDGSVEQLRTFLAKHEISEDTVVNIVNFDPANEHLFYSAKVDTAEFSTLRSVTWRKNLQEIISFARSYTPCEKVECINDNVMKFGNLKSLSGGKVVDLFSNFSKEKQKITISSNKEIIQVISDVSEEYITKIDGDEVILPPFSFVVIG